MDQKAKKILFNTYWKNGWIDKADIRITIDDFEYAKSKGLMFDPVTLTHDECIEKILNIVSKMEPDMAAKSFLSSLSSRRPDWRSGVASYYIGKQITRHKYQKAVSGYFYEQGEKIPFTYTCGICRNQKYGIIGRECYQNIDLSVYNFERIKWGGVRHGELAYTLFDLKQFLRDEIPEPNDEDLEIFKTIFATIDNCRPDDGPRELEKKLATVFKSNKSEREVLIEILACINILEAKRTSRKGSMKSDWVFCGYWKGEDKYNKDVVNEIFKKYIHV